MPSPQEIVLQLQDCLPRLTDRFHDELPVTGAIVSSGILTITFPSAHGLSVNEKIFINQALIRNEITSIVTNADDTVSYFTKDIHDLTAFRGTGHGNTWPEGLSVTLELPGPTTVVVTLVPDATGVPHENEFVGIEGSPTPSITGGEFLLENRAVGVLGVKTVATVPDTLNITIDLSDVPDVPDGPLDISHILNNVRVTTVANIDRATEIYTKQDDPKGYIFVVMLDRVASKNRQNDDDFKSLPLSQLRLLNIREQFSILVLMPTEDNLGASDIKSFVYKEIFSILLKCLYGWEGTGYISDGESIYNTSYYAHAFDWEVRQQIDFTSGFENNNNTVALRQITFKQTVFDAGDSDGQIDFK